MPPYTPMDLASLTNDRSAFGQWNLAKSYLMAATLLMNSEPVIIQSLYFLITHAIELALKAFLIGNGVKKNTVRTWNKHDIQGLLERAAQEGLVLPEKEYETIRATSPAARTFYAR